MHAAPGGTSTISLGADINTTSATTTDKSDAAAIAFLQEANQKFKTAGKLAVRDFHMIGQFPLFEQTYGDLRISSMSYAEKVNASAKLLNSLNNLVGEPANRTVLQNSTNATAAPAQPQCAFEDSTTSGASRTKCVGGVAENTIGDVPSVKIHHAPGGSSSIQLW